MRRRTVLVAGLAAVGCSREGTQQVPKKTLATTTTSPTPAEPPRSQSTPWATPRHSPAKVVAGLERRGVRISMSWWDGSVRSTGSLKTAPAWSTIKVPLVLAAASGSASDKRAAIRASDNEAAERLWASLGRNDVHRAGKLTQQLRRGGDRRTIVPTTPLMPPWSVFGQTPWAAADQLRYLLGLSALPDADALLEDMRHLDAQQQWGIADRTRPVAKGGWGPMRHGGYLVRQFGWFEVSGVKLPVAMAVEAGSFGEGTQVLTTLATAL